MVKVTESVIGCRLGGDDRVRGCVIDGSIAISCLGYKIKCGMLFLSAGMGGEAAKLPIALIKDIRKHYGVIIITLKRH